MKRTDTAIQLRHFERGDAKSVQTHLYPELSEPDIAEMITEWNSGVY